MDEIVWTCIEPCGACGGDGGGFTMPTSAVDTERWCECLQCGGTGKIEVECEPAGDWTDDATVL